MFQYGYPTIAVERLPRFLTKRHAGNPAPQAQSSAYSDTYFGDRLTACANRRTSWPHVSNRSERLGYCDSAANGSLYALQCLCQQCAVSRFAKALPVVPGIPQYLRMRALRKWRHEPCSPCPRKKPHRFRWERSFRAFFGVPLWRHVGGSGDLWRKDYGPLTILHGNLTMEGIP